MKEREIHLPFLQVHLCDVSFPFLIVKATSLPSYHLVGHLVLVHSPTHLFFDYYVIKLQGQGEL